MQKSDKKISPSRLVVLTGRGGGGGSRHLGEREFESILP